MVRDTTKRLAPRWADRLGAYTAGTLIALGLATGLTPTAPAVGAQTPVAHKAASFSRARRRALQAYSHDHWLLPYGFGRKDKHAARAHAAVVGGVQRSIEEFPWQVVIFAEFEFEGEEWLTLCGGSIVEMSYVVTAAHCTYDPFTQARLPADSFVVLAGVSSLSSEEIEHSATAEASFVSGVRRHPDFDFAAGPGTPDDVAVLDLEKALVPSAGVRAVTLPSSPVPPTEGTAATFSGFGAENTTDSELNGSLYSLTTTLTSARRCGGEAEAVFICASAPAGTACHGDSGGGLVESLNGTPTLIGVVDTIQASKEQECPAGALDGFANVTAPEIRDFIEGTEDPPLAPRGGGVSMHGVFTVGHEVTCEPGSWRNNPTFTYAFVDGAGEQVLQKGASPNLMLAAADAGQTISCHLEATNPGGTARVRTEDSTPVKAAPSSGNNGGGNGGADDDNNSGTSTAPAVTPGPGTGESAHGGVLGYHAGHIGAAEIAALLRKEIVPREGFARISALLAVPRYTLAFRALEAGGAVVKWYAMPSGGSTRKGRGKPVLIATGRAVFAKAGTTKLAIEMTAAGRRLLRSSRSLRCTAEGTFTPHDGGPVVAARSFALLD